MTAAVHVSQGGPRRFGGPSHIGGYGLHQDPRGLIATGIHRAPAPDGSGLIGILSDAGVTAKGGLGVTYEAILDQGQTSECTGFATSIGLTEQMKVRGTPLPERISPHSIYIPARALDRVNANMDKLSDNGAMPSQVWRAVSTFGATLESQWPSTPETINDEPTLDELELSSVLIFKGAFKLYETGDDLVARVRQCLSKRLALLFAIDVDQDFENNSGDVLGAMTGPGLGGHYEVACEYETLASGVTVVHWKNSWGTTWGEGGWGKGNNDFIKRWTDVYALDVAKVQAA